MIHVDGLRNAKARWIMPIASPPSICCEARPYDGFSSAGKRRKCCRIKMDGVSGKHRPVGPQRRGVAGHHSGSNGRQMPFWMAMAYSESSRTINVPS